MSTISKKKSINDILAHCKRELFHAIWNLLLDDEFVEAYRNGIIIKCYDGKYRRVFPRIFTYSADYPEKYNSIFTSCRTWRTHYITAGFSSPQSGTREVVLVHGVLSPKQTFTASASGPICPKGYPTYVHIYATKLPPHGLQSTITGHQ